MDRPAVLLVEPDAGLRKSLSTGLSRYHYEVVPAVDPAEGARFAERLAPSVVVADARLPGFGDAAVLECWAGGPGMPRTLVLLARQPLDESDLPEAVRVVPVGDLPVETVVQRVRLVVLGRQMGVDADPWAESLVGDLEQSPPLELVRSLHEARFTGRLELGRGEVRLVRGEVVAATADALGGRGGRRVGGRKAFCRLGRRRQGTFHVRSQDEIPPAPAEEAVAERLERLVVRAVEDASVTDPFDPRARLHLQLGPAFFAAEFTPLEQRLLGHAQRNATVGAVLDLLEETDGQVLAALGGLLERSVVRVEEPEARLYVVTDSSADLPVEVARAHGIQVVPLSVRFGDALFHDGVDLGPKAFYEQLQSRREHPQTSPPTPAELLERYGELLRRRDVVSVHLSEKLSQTVVHARRAAEQALVAAAPRRADEPPPALHVVDSGLVSLALGLLALFAARLAARDFEPDEVVRRVDAMKGRMSALFVVDTLEYLRRGGRIGAARALVGRLLGIKPILGIGDGEVVPVDRVRGGRAAHPRILELLAARVDPARPLVAAVAHANAPVWADRLRGLLEERFELAELMVSEIGPTVGTHGGPGTVGVAWLQPTAEELPLIAPLEG